MAVSDKVRESGLLLGALGVIGVIGIVFLMIYGNLSGNLGFSQDSNVTVNETLTAVNETGSILSINSLRGGGCAITTVTNQSITVLGRIDPGNFTISGCNISYTAAGANPDGFNNTLWNVTYTGSFDSDASLAADSVIDNTTSGFQTFFGFSNTFFTIAAVILLIFMLIGLLAIVMKIMRIGKGSGRGETSIPK